MSLNPMNMPTQKCILVLAANPRGTESVELERAAALIRAQLSKGRYGKDYQIQIERGIRLEDLRRYLVEYKPTIVHVVGQGSATGEILLADESDRVAPVTPTEIAHLFATEEQQIECVVLNSCFSLEMADALLDFIPCTIGVDEDNYNPAAVTFISEFYRGIFAGKGYYGAYELGRKQISAAEREATELPCLMTIDRTLLGIPPEYDRPSTVRSGSSQSSQTDAPIVYPLWYGTNRKPKPIDANGVFKGFSRQGEDRIHYGTCEVVVKKTHKFGSDEEFKKLPTNNTRLDRASLQQMIEEDFWASIQSNLAKIDRGKRNALVFIHGYHVSFESAAKTAAQLGCDLKIPMTAFYSWPSQASLQGYGADGASLEASEHHITKFLIEFVKVAQADRVHIIAHSMGNRGLLRSIDKIAKEFVGKPKPFEQIILAAPDVEQTLFKNKATAYQSIADRTTLYVSRKDNALRASSWMNGNARTGFSEPVTIVPTIDTIDVSNTDLSLLGHGYCMEDRDVLRDMHSLLNKNQPPESRGLGSGVYEAQKYWTIKQSPRL
jgi:esterase/lipase superfamily enzyme